MASSEETPEAYQFNAQEQDTGAFSLRSRASSVVSTGTKISISTLPQEEHANIDLLFNRRNFRITARSGSLLSIRTFDQPCPPYDYDDPYNPTPQAMNPSPRCPSPENPPASTSTSLPTPSSPTSPSSPLPLLPPSPTSPSSPTSQNALSTHYSTIVRTIDHNHALELSRLAQTHQQALAQTRHAIDQAYRKELKAKDREVEKIREEAAAQIAALETHIQNLTVAHGAGLAQMEQVAAVRVMELEDVHAVFVDRARNAVEDIWEGRWNDRMRVAAEEARRIDMESQKRLERAVAERDEEWVEELARRRPELSDELRLIMEGLRPAKERDGTI